MPPVRPIRTLQFDPALPPALEPLRAISQNFAWSWNTAAQALFARMGAESWALSGQNPVRLLQLLGRDDFARLAADEGFLAELERVHAGIREYLGRPSRLTVPGTNAKEVIAYFSLEFAITESLPIYSGGLGVLAGDHLKSASDLGLPLVAVGLLYQQGYFQQVLGPDGWQHEEYSNIEPGSQPLHRVLGADGAPLMVEVPFPGRAVHAAVWRVDVGQVPLYLLDSSVDENVPEDRQISARLYGGDLETRIEQEMLLGIGGVRALAAMGLTPAVCHMNEGHSALLGVERIRMLMEQTGATFEEAMLPVAAATVFTTHTAVAAGIDLFPPELVRRYLGHYYGAMGVSDQQFLGLGRLHPDDAAEPFSMAVLGLRLSGYRNGVSVLHRTVSRRLWEGAWPQLPVEEVPIDSVTNGVHLATWVSHEMGGLYDRFVGPHWRDDPARPQAWTAVASIPDEELWETHERERELLVRRAQQQHLETAARSGLAGSHPLTGKPLEPRVLTVGFARRFAQYKRATLLFRDPERLARILNHPERPVQFIFAGKAHPRDEAAKQLIREVVHYSRLPEFRDRLVVLERYDVELARTLVQGSDVWMNTPLRPLEASGTSGMKAVANGGLHLSVLDGWWAEAYQPGAGWSVGRDRIDDDPEVQDAFDAESLYDLLENEVAPAFYDRDADGVPRRWVGMMKASIAAYAPQFNTDRMVAEYAERAYGPAAKGWHALRADGLAPARRLSAWLGNVRRGWDGVQVFDVRDEGDLEMRAGQPVRVHARVQPGSLDPADLAVHVVYGEARSDGSLMIAGEAALKLDFRGEDGVCQFSGEFVSEVSGRVGYAVRVLPSHEDLPNALATGLVRWA